jgi:hypothetical protein
MAAAQKLGLDVDYDVTWRVAIVSDGFPYYIHLITEAMLWQAADDVDVCEVLTMEHYQLGLLKAVAMVSMWLQEPYRHAVLHRGPEMEDVVWATADGEDLWRDTRAMYASYMAIVEKRERQDVMDRAGFTKTLSKLKNKGYGAILQSVENRAGWYTYTEKMVRGYVRMQAEAQGFELTGEKPMQRQRMHVSASARSGYYESRIPRGARLSFKDNQRDSEEDEA